MNVILKILNLIKFWLPIERICEQKEDCLQRVFERDPKEQDFFIQGECSVHPTRVLSLWLRMDTDDIVGISSR